MCRHSQAQPQHPGAAAAGQGAVPPQVAAPAANPQRLGLRRGGVAPTAGALAVAGELGPSKPMPAGHLDDPLDCGLRAPSDDDASNDVMGGVPLAPHRCRPLGL